MRCDAPETEARLPQPADFLNGPLLLGINFQKVGFRNEFVAMADVPNTFAFALLWRKASRVRSPMASRSHWLTAPIIVITSRPAAEPVSSDSATEISATLRFSRSSSGAAKILHTSSQPVQLSDDHRLYLAGVHHTH
ncbi:MAG: hypothetical protein ABI995_05575 [Acidobacteriota bacterium]